METESSDVAAQYTLNIALEYTHEPRQAHPVAKPAQGAEQVIINKRPDLYYICSAHTTLVTSC